MHMVETECRCWVPGAGVGAVSWLSAWWRQGASAGAGCWLCRWWRHGAGCRVPVLVRGDRLPVPVLGAGCARGGHRVPAPGAGAGCWLCGLGALQRQGAGAGESGCRYFQGS